MTEAPASDKTSAADADVVDIDPEDRLRADTYRLLGRLLGRPPDDETLALLASAPTTEHDNLLAAAWRLLATTAARSRADQVSSEYEALFIGLGRGELVPYASWYLTGYLMERPLAELRADMRQLGFELHDNVSEPEDHAAALCEIMALLATETDPSSLARQATFFETHIGPWLARFFRDMQQAESAGFYRAVGQLGEQFIETDQRYLEMVQRPDGARVTRSRPGLEAHRGPGA